MSLLEAIVLGLMQGLTEFIPVSSSGHLVFLHEIFDTGSGGLTFDVALHLGTLGALLIYFYRDIILLIKGVLGKNEYTTVAWFIAFATIPAVIFGMLFKDSAETVFRSPRLVALNLILFALLMLAAERYAKRREGKTEELRQTSFTQALAVGAAQALAIIPGVSRSGSTITAGLFVGLGRVAATRFSFLLGIPVMIGAILKVSTEDGVLTMIQADAGLFAVGIATALLSGLFAIRFLLKYLAKHTLAIFAYYRIVLGVAVLAINML